MRERFVSGRSHRHCSINLLTNCQSTTYKQTKTSRKGSGKIVEQTDTKHTEPEIDRTNIEHFTKASVIAELSPTCMSRWQRSVERATERQAELFQNHLFVDAIGLYRLSVAGWLWVFARLGMPIASHIIISIRLHVSRFEMREREKTTRHTLEQWAVRFICVTARIKTKHITQQQEQQTYTWTEMTTIVCVSSQIKIKSIIRCCPGFTAFPRARPPNDECSRTVSQCHQCGEQCTNGQECHPPEWQMRTFWAGNTTHRTSCPV